MHTLSLLAGGFVLLAICVGLSHFLTGHFGRGALWFIPLWLVIAAINMWVGITRAGYSVAAEAPIFLVVFGIPAIAAWLIRRKYPAA